MHRPHHAGVRLADSTDRVGDGPTAGQGGGRRSPPRFPDEGRQTLSPDRAEPGVDRQAVAVEKGDPPASTHIGAQDLAVDEPLPVVAQQQHPGRRVHPLHEQQQVVPSTVHGP